MRQIALVIAIGLLLAACGSTQTPQPVGVGRGIDTLKGTPCAGPCTAQPNPPYNIAGSHAPA